MTTAQILFAIHNAIKTPYQIDVNEAKDTLTFKYTARHKRYQMVFIGISDIHSKLQLDVLIKTIQLNIEYHSQKQETKRR